MNAPERDAGYCRSLLFVPASRPDRFDTALASGADIVCADLEDAVAPRDRADARAAVMRFLHRQDSVPEAGTPRRAVRINSPLCRDGLEDLLALLDAVPPEGIVCIPKVDSAAEIGWIDTLLAPLPGLRLAAIIETARGLEAAPAIAAASPRLDMLVFGAVDLAGEMGIAPLAPALTYARGRVVSAAHAAGIAVLDSPCLDFRDAEATGREAAQARQVGFTGKSAIHPAGIKAIHAAFTPGPEELDTARRIVAAADAAGGGVTTVDGMLVEEPIVRRMRRLLQRAGGSGSDGTSSA